MKTTTIYSARMDLKPWSRKFFMTQVEQSGIRIPKDPVGFPSKSEILLQESNNFRWERCRNETDSLTQDSDGKLQASDPTLPITWIWQREPMGSYRIWSIHCLLPFASMTPLVRLEQLLMVIIGRWTSVHLYRLLISTFPLFNAMNRTT